jgi:6,7-dimethyl-8-ribityllumazine synthase
MTFTGNLIAQEGQRFGIVISRYNDFISSKLLEGCLDTLYRHGVAENMVDIAWVPGSFEIPLVAQTMAFSKKYSAVICLGAVIRGSTTHFDLVSAEVAKGVAQASMSSKIPVIFGVITTDTIEQAIERAGTKAGNKGSEAALAALEMSDLISKINS